MIDPTTPTPTNDAQWAEMLKHTERLRVAEMQEETKRQDHQLQREAQERADRRRWVLKMLMGSIVIAMVIGFFSMMVFFIDEDVDSNMRMNEICTQQGRAYDVGDKICYPPGELPKHLR